MQLYTARRVRLDDATKERYTFVTQRVHQRVHQSRGRIHRHIDLISSLVPTPLSTAVFVICV